MPCLTPFKKQTGEIVPCGKCPDCRKRRVSGWSFRLLEELKRRATSAHFLTLTYEDMKLPYSPTGNMTLDSSDQEHYQKQVKKHTDGTVETYWTLNTKRHLQLFFKLLRKANPGVKIRYYAVGEYGSKTKRPHYHIILFNADQKTIQPAWPHGTIHYGNVSPASVGYTLKYMSKPKTVPAYKGDDRLPEFSLMSKDLVRLISTKKCYDTINQT